MVKERALQQLKDAEGGAAVEAAVGRHGKALLKALAEKMLAGNALGTVALADVCQIVQTELADEYDSDFMRIAWERHVQTGMRSMSQQQITDSPSRDIMQQMWPVPDTGVQVLLPATQDSPAPTSKQLFAEQTSAAGVSTADIDEFILFHRTCCRRS